MTTKGNVNFEQSTPTLPMIRLHDYRLRFQTLIVTRQRWDGCSKWPRLVVGRRKWCHDWNCLRGRKVNFIARVVMGCVKQHLQLMRQ